MYQFVVSKDVVPPFTLSMAHPQRCLPLQTMLCDSVVPFANTLLIVTPDDETDCLDTFINVNICEHYFNFYSMHVHRKCLLLGGGRMVAFVPKQMV